MISVIATIKLKSGQRDPFLRIFRELTPQVHAERGCVEYFPATDINSGIELQGQVRDHVVTVIEKWESLEALQDHLDAPHMHAFRERVADMTESLSLQVVAPA